MRRPFSHAALLPWLLLLGSACSSNSPNDKNQGVTTIGGLQPGQQPENTEVEAALSVGEWSYVLPAAAGSSATEVKEYFWLCGGGHFAYRREGDFAADAVQKPAFTGVAAGSVKKGVFQIFGQDYVKVLDVTLESAAVKSFDLVTDDSSFTVSEKRFVRTYRGCEVAYN